MAFSTGMRVGVKKNPVLGRNAGEWRKFGARSNVAVMASIGSPGLREEYKTLRLSPGATEKEVKKAYRRLASKFHPDVCKGDNCLATFHKISEAYQTVILSLAQAKEQKFYEDDNTFVEVMMGDLWEEEMGWEGGNVTRDYSNHINMYA
uniref:TSA: Wollemia nobilis Ref_Wollemi_Transcript_14374_1007 transcribed RNA sequence n=1 Tax=Wollemia nobilis TaxID=56998 RepID=A0A0C9S421_9CONI